MAKTHQNDQESGQNKGRRRGRPRGGSRANVHDDLIRAMRDCLEERAHTEITLKEVAERADASQEMVRYYFGSKNGLLIAVLRETSSRFVEALEALEATICEGDGNPTRRLIAALMELYFKERHISRIPTLEFQRSHSVIREEFLNDRSEVVVASIHRIIKRLIRAGIYTQQLDSYKMAVTIMTMISGPVSLLSTLPEPWVDAKTLPTDEWIDHLTQIIDQRCRMAPLDKP